MQGGPALGDSAPLESVPRVAPPAPSRNRQKIRVAKVVQQVRWPQGPAVLSRPAGLWVSTQLGGGQAVLGGGCGQGAGDLCGAPSFKCHALLPQED